MKRILVVETAAPGRRHPGGDLFQRPFGEGFPKARITALVQPPAHELYKVSGSVRRGLGLPPGCGRPPALLPAGVEGPPAWPPPCAGAISTWPSICPPLPPERPNDHPGKPGAEHRPGLRARVRGYYGLAASGRDELKTHEVELDRRVLALLGLVPRPHDREGGSWRVPSQALE